MLLLVQLDLQFLRLQPLPVVLLDSMSILQVLLVHHVPYKILVHVVLAAQIIFGIVLQLHVHYALLKHIHALQQQLYLHVIVDIIFKLLQQLQLVLLLQLRHAHHVQQVHLYVDMIPMAILILLHVKLDII